MACSESIPDDLIRASASLGAKPMATFTRVILPLAVPGLIVGAVLVFTGSFTAYATPNCSAAKARWSWAR
ncbi:ABC transporter permease subunit [Devosia sp. A8/3-2]|nr:ABC transporter permease subunit [Devosia sp. A8/3-2]